MLQFSYYQDATTEELQEMLRRGKQWLHRIGDEAELRALFTFSTEKGKDFTVLTGGELPRSLHIHSSDGTRTEWASPGALILITNSATEMTAREIENFTRAPEGSVLAMSELESSEAIVPGPPPHPQVMEVLANIHSFALRLRQKSPA